jgi:hypothetical protein
LLDYSCRRFEDITLSAQASTTCERGGVAELHACCLDR